MQEQQGSGQVSEEANLEELLARFREIKHEINNSLGVVMALSELAERRPDSLPKLKSVVLERCPKMVEDLQAFSVDLQSYVRRHPGA